MLPLEPITVGQMLRRTAARVPLRPALEYRGTVWSYAELDRTVDLFARRLLGWGVRRGDHLGIWCEAEPNAIFLLYAAVRIGAVATLLNTELQRPELKQLLGRTDVAYLAIGDGYKALDYPALCQGLTGELPLLRGVCYIGLSGRSGTFSPLSSLPRASEEDLRRSEACVTPEDTAFILYTSGTTSAPKAVMDSHFSRANSGIQQARDLGATEADRFCVAMPLFHCFCLSVNVMAACAVGACLYLPESRRTTPLLSALSQGRCTILSCVPALYRAMLCRPDFLEWDLSSLRTGFIGGSLYPPALFRRINNAFGFTLLSSLGQTEATAGITTSFLHDSLEVRSSTVGHFMDHVEGRITDLSSGRPLPPGEIGEICVRGYVIMQGYYGQPEETQRAIDREGWLHTGDLGYLDPEGNLHLTGRLKELIIRGGENISPAEIELALAEEPSVAACKAVGVPDEHYGEEVCLCVIPAPGGTCTEEQLRSLLSARLAQFKLPRYILFLDGFPRTTSGKIQSAALAGLAAQRLGWLFSEKTK